jgi:hypothetical protein
MEDSKFMKPSRFPARDEYAVREEGGSAMRETVVLERGQNRSKSAGDEGAPESLSDFVHGDAIDKKLTLDRASADNVPTLYQAASLALVPAGTRGQGEALGKTISLSLLTNPVTVESVTCKVRAEWISSAKLITSES